MKIVLVVILLSLETFAFDIHNIYTGVDVTVNAKGDKSYGSSTDAMQFTYKVDQGVQYKLGYKFNHVIKLEYGYSKFYSDEYKNFDLHSLTTSLSLKYIGSKFIFKTPYNIYPSYEIGITRDVYNAGASLNFDYENYALVISYKTFLHGLNFGGGSNSVEGYYLGIRYYL